EDHVGALADHRLGLDVGLAGVVEAADVTGRGEVLAAHLDVVAARGLDALLETGLELLDQRGLDPADEADLALGALVRRGHARQERALLLGEHQRSHVLRVHRVVVDDGELGVGVLPRDLADGLGVGEAHGDDRVVALVGHLLEALFLRRLGLVARGRALVALLRAELLDRVVDARSSGVVERGVTPAADIEGEADLQVAGVDVRLALALALLAALRSGGRLLGDAAAGGATAVAARRLAVATGILGATRHRQHAGHGDSRQRSTTLSPHGDTPS